MDDDQERLLAGHTPKSQVIVLSRDVEYLIQRVTACEKALQKLEPLVELLPQLRELLEERRRNQWLLRRIGVLFVGVPTAVAALYQLAKTLVEWIRGQ